MHGQSPQRPCQADDGSLARHAALAMTVLDGDNAAGPTAMCRHECVIVLASDSRPKRAIETQPAQQLVSLGATHPGHEAAG